MKGNCGNYCRMSDACCSEPNANNKFCYRAQCIQTSKAVAERLGMVCDQGSWVMQGSGVVHVLWWWLHLGVAC